MQDRVPFILLQVNQAVGLIYPITTWNKLVKLELQVTAKKNKKNNVQ